MSRRTILVAALFAAMGVPALAGQPDHGLFAMFNNYHTGILFNVCGHVGKNSGCDGSVYMKPFDDACAILQGRPKTSGNTITRAIYVLDKRTSTTDDVMLYVYERKDVIAHSYDSVSAKLKTTIDLGITGGSAAHCMLAGNDDYVYASTDASANIVGVGKHSSTLEHMAGRAQGDSPVSIWADDRGFVIMNYTYDSYVVDPHGYPQEDGGGNYAFVNQRNGAVQN